MKHAPHNKRFEARLTPEQRKRMQKAAGYEGLSLVDFMVKYADEAAIRAIQWHTSWALEQRDRDVFVKNLFSPPEPIAPGEASAAIELEAAEKW